MREETLRTITQIEADAQPGRKSAAGAEKAEVGFILTGLRGSFSVEVTCNWILEDP